MPVFKKNNPGCGKISGCDCPFCGCGTYLVLDLTMLGGGGNQIVADGLALTQPTQADCNRFSSECEWTGNTTSVSLAACGTPPAFFFVVLRFRWYGNLFNKCTVEIELWNSSAKTTLYATLASAGINCCGIFTTVSFTVTYNALACSVPSTITLEGDGGDFEECDEPNCGENPTCPGSEETPVDPPDTCPVDCCPDPPTQMEVDLGAGGLTADDCTGGGCAAIAGTFTLDPYWVFSRDCAWSYTEEEWCTTGGDCEPEDGCFEHFTLFILLLVNRSTCKLECYVVWGAAGGSDDCTCDIGTGALYRSTDVLDSGESCVGSWTLNKVSEDWGGTCGGSLPSSITVTSL